VMRILIVGNDPIEIGGVANYTRPLALKFQELGNEVHYLYSGAFRNKYNLLIAPYIRTEEEHFPFKCAEIVNSDNLPFNFGHPELDIHSQRMETIINRYLDRIKPDVMHVHSRLGFPCSINEIAHKKGIVVLNTIHVYGYICQRRVMIDSGGNPCNGPADIIKCAFCNGTLNLGKEKLRAGFRNFMKTLQKRSERLYGAAEALRKFLKQPVSPIDQVTPPPLCADRKQMVLLSERLEERLQYNINTLNTYSRVNICVSTDVKRTLMNYGVKEQQLLVQHIGSTIAEKQIQNEHPLHKPVVIGNIGGVDHYKGTHVLIDAASRIDRKDFILKIFGKYKREYVEEISKGKDNLTVEFVGRYEPKDLPDILRQIDIMVLPSICNDTAPQTIFEAYSHGIPIIASDIGGFPDFITNNVNGLLFKAGNSKDLARQIGFILSHPEKISEYRKQVPRLKTINDNATELILLYKDLLSSF
jgi:glycosyltransferase involved in cell wall biosynthesis